jgi:hypothetical protein
MGGEQWECICIYWFTAIFMNTRRYVDTLGVGIAMHLVYMTQFELVRIESLIIHSLQLPFQNMLHLPCMSLEEIGIQGAQVRK